jgi:uncharacterized protein YraI
VKESDMARKHVVHLLILVALAALLAGCGSRRGGDATPTPTKTPAAAAPVEQVTPAPPAAAPDTSAPADQPAVAQPAVAQPTPTPQTVTRGKVTATLLNIRAEPSAEAALAGTADEGQEFDIVGRSADGAWLQLATDGRLLGWATAEFLEVTQQTVAAPAAQPGEVAAAQPAAPAQGSGSYLPASMTSPDYGAQAFLWWRSEIADRDLDLMREAGFDWVKQTFAWETIEGAGRDVYDWSVADRVVTHVNDKGLKLLARMSIDPDKREFWAGEPPGNSAAFAEYVGAVAQRYNCTPEAVGCIQAFQIWNEPNLAREWGGRRPNPAEYAAFLKEAYSAIKAVHPTAIVISAGMAPTGDDSDIAMPDDKFYDLMYQAMGGNSDGYFDKLGVHGAGYAAPPELDPAEAAANKEKYGGARFFAFRHVEDIREIMVRYGDADKQIVLLEFGWTYDKVNPSYKWHGADAGIDEFVQADYLTRAYKYAAANWTPWIGLMNLLTMPNLDWLNDGNPQDEEQYWWAIMDPSPIDQKYWRPAYIFLCTYLMEEVKGQTCIYRP